MRSLKKPSPLCRDVIAIIILCLAVSAFASNPSANKTAKPKAQLQNNNITATRENNQAIAALKKKDADKAESKLLSALGADPFNPILHLNLGWLFEKEKKYDMAVREYQSVLRDSAVRPIPDELKFIAHFNAGNALAEKKDIPGALKQYQAALDLNPDSKETKINIELLFKGGGGQGKGSGQKKQSQKNKKNGNKKQPNKNQNNNQNQRYTNKGHPKPKFNSKDLTREDVRKIMDELKSEEQKVRSRIYDAKTKDTPPAKNW